ncbi:TGS domain-containing protein, partial [Lactobacillus mulieris]|nr:GTP pyrophosphokinase [Lactobacillus mulieris]
VNDKLVPLDYRLKNGDVVSILTQSNAEPSPDWIHMVKTSRARNKIRRFLKEQRKDENIEKGRNDVANLLRERGLSAKEYLDKDHIQKLLN